MNIVGFIASTLATAIAILLLGLIFPSIRIRGILASVVLAIVLNLLNAYLLPVLLGMVHVTGSGIVSIIVGAVLNGIVLCIAFAITGAGSVNGLGTAIIMSFLISFLQNIIMNLEIFQNLFR